MARRKYTYENDEVKREAKLFIDRLYQASKRGSIDRELYEKVLDELANVNNITSDIIDWQNDIYKFNLQDRKSNTDNYDAEYEKDIPNLRYEAYQQLVDLIYSQPDFVDSVVHRKHGDRIVQVENAAKIELIHYLGMWESALGQDGLGQLCLDHSQFIEDVATLLSFGYKTYMIEYKDLLNEVRDYVNYYVFDDEYYSNKYSVNDDYEDEE